MAKKILYKNHCTAQEQPTSGGRYYLESNCGRKLTGSSTLTLGSGATTFGTLESTGTLGGASGFDFISVRVISGDDVGLSFDATTNPVIKLKKGECFSSEILAAAEPKVIINGVSVVEYMTGT